MGWLYILVLGAATFFALWKSKRMNNTALELAGVAVLIGLAGYAWQGAPSLAGSPTSHVKP
jgi:cytochrome c-type biogenesis protein CcmH